MADRPLPGWGADRIKCLMSVVDYHGERPEMRSSKLVPLDPLQRINIVMLTLSGFQFYAR